VRNRDPLIGKNRAHTPFFPMKTRLTKSIDLVFHLPRMCHCPEAHGRLGRSKPVRYLLIVCNLIIDYGRAVYAS